ncbi:ZN616-like protein [Mya arenaria]|uniref:ZN616-like protein n=1 Tax=Mya arenaria TaxID=6604 RepID=A0ABY7ESB5_MYAAR|nr:ZN616-like protein [Mya arenaria]
MAMEVENGGAVVKDLDSLAVQFGQSLMESDLKTYNEDSSDSDNSNNSSKDNINDDSLPSTVHNIGLNSAQGEEAGIYQVGQDASVVLNPSGQKVYRCQDCGLTYNKPSSFSNHRLAHHPSVCPHCGRRFSMPSSLESHLQLVCERKGASGEGAFECHICHKKMTTKKVLLRHLRIHSNVGSFSCKICSKTFGIQSSLDFHMKSHDLQKPFRCKLCMVTFTEKSTVVRHLKRQHDKSIDLNSYIENNLVPESPVELATQLGSFSGRKPVAKTEVEPPVDIKPNIQVKSHSTPSLKSLLEQPLATFNPIASTLLSSAINMHKMSQEKTPIKQEQPDPISESESDDEEEILSPDSIQGLVKDAMGKLPSLTRSFQCKLCNKTYYHSSSLNKHMKKHNIGDAFQCQICRKKCVSKRDLTSHMLCHRGAGCFACPICGTTCARKGSTLRHIRQAHGFSIEHAREVMNMDMKDKQSTTNVSSKSDVDTNYDSNSTFDDREDPKFDHDEEFESELDESVDHYTCSICEQIFMEKNHLISHYENVHSVDPDKAVNELSSPKLTEIKKKDPRSLLGQTIANQRSAVTINNDNLFDTTLSVVVEKDNEGVQKVIKVMPERGSKLPAYLQNYDVPSSRRRLVQDPEAEAMKPYKCNMCGTRFVEKSSVRRHLKRSHNYTIEEAKEYMIRNDYTKETPTKGENSIDEFHSLAQMNEDSSDKYFSELTEKEHLEDHEDKQKQRTYLCSVCSKRFMLRSSVRRHMRKFHSFSLDEARECDIMAEESTEVRTRRTSADIKRAVAGEELIGLGEGQKASRTPNKKSSARFKEQLSCKFCGQIYTQRFGLKRHLISLHQLDSKDADMVIENEIKEPKQSCPLCFTEFDSAQTVKEHLMKLHRVSETVAARLMGKHTMCDYTEASEGIDDDISRSMSVDEENDFSLNTLNQVESLQKSSGLLTEKEMLDKGEFDINEPSAMFKQDDQDILFDLKSNKEALLVDLNFEAINPWGSDGQSDDLDPEGLGIISGDSGLDFKLAGNEKLIDSMEHSDMTTASSGISYDDNETEASTSISQNKTGSLPSIYGSKKIFKYDCPICKKVLSDASARSKHIRRHEGTAGFQCGLCNKIYLQLRMIESHLKTHGGFGVKCGICFIYCAERNGAKRHLQRMHSMEGNTDALEPYILQCGLDTDNVDELLTNYTVVDLAQENNIVTVVPEVLMGWKHDVEKWEKDKIAVPKIEMDPNDESLSIKEENEEIATEDPLNERTEEKDEKLKLLNTKTKIDSVITNLHKKLLTRSITSSDKDDQSLNDEDSESPSVIDSPQSIYSAEKTSPLKLTFRKKTKMEQNYEGDVENKLIENLRERENGEASDSDRTEDLDFESNEMETGASKGKALEGSSIGVDKTDIEMLDKEILNAILPHFEGDGGKLDALDATLKGLSQKSPRSPKKTVPHLLCWECGKSYSNYKSFREHQRKKHPLSCNKCHKVFVDPLLYQGHMAQHTDGKAAPKNHDCPVCGKEFKDASSRAKHLRLHTGEKPYRCEECGKRFTQTGHLASHMRIHNGEKPFDCKLCGRFFTEKSSVKRHLRKMHFNQYNKKCTVCGIISKTREEHKAHLITHKQRVYTCQFCSKDFMDSRALKVHTFNAHSQMTVSVNMREYRCHECNKQFFSSKGLKNHLKVHSGDFKMFSCRVCNKLFVTEQGLSSHAKVHTRNKDLYCDICHKDFKSRAYSAFHKKQHILDKVNQLVSGKDSRLRNLTVKKEPSGTDDSVEINAEQEKQIDHENEKLSTNSNEMMPNDVNSDFRKIQAGFPDYVIRFIEQKQQSSFYFIKVDEDNPSNTEGENTNTNEVTAAATFSPDTRNNAWFQMNDGDKKARGFAVYRCDECCTFKLRKREIIRHQETAHSLRQGYSCTECSAIFPTRVLLGIHRKRVHPQLASNNKFRCPLCGKTFSNRGAYRNMPFSCSKCGKKFLTRHSLVFHMESHLSKRFECRKCGTKFVHQRSYDQHTQALCMGLRKRIAARKQMVQLPNIESGHARKALICIYCQKEFNYLRTMEIHVHQTHPEHSGELTDAFIEQEAPRVTAYTEIMNQVDDAIKKVVDEQVKTVDSGADGVTGNNLQGEECNPRNLDVGNDNCEDSSPYVKWELDRESTSYIEKCNMLNGTGDTAASERESSLANASVNDIPANIPVMNIKEEPQ